MKILKGTFTNNADKDYFVGKLYNDLLNDLLIKYQDLEYEEKCNAIATDSDLIDFVEEYEKDLNSSYFNIEIVELDACDYVLRVDFEDYGYTSYTPIAIPQKENSFKGLI